MDLRKSFRLGLVFIALLVGVIAIVSFFGDHAIKRTEAISLTPAATQDETVQRSNVEIFFGKVVPRPKAVPQGITWLPVVQESLKLNAPHNTPQDDLQLLEILLEQYRRVLKENPSGENGEI